MMYPGYAMGSATDLETLAHVSVARWASTALTIRRRRS